MKNPLSYQTTEYDCGPTTLINAISFLFRREEIPPEVIKHIMIYCLDAYNIKGEFGKSGTSRMAMLFLSEWLNQYSKTKKFPVQCEFLSSCEVTLAPGSRIVTALHQGAAVVLRVRYGCWHYVLLTGTEGDRAALFDPYYRKKPFTQAGIEMVSGKPCSMNRRVTFDTLNSTGHEFYATGPRETREAMILFDKRRHKPVTGEIEYFI